MPALPGGRRVVLLRASKSVTYTPWPSGPQPIIRDGDDDSDIDDILDEALTFSLQRRGECSVIAVVISSQNDYAGPCAASRMAYYGQSAIPIGVDHTGRGNQTTSAYTQSVAAAYPVPGKTAWTDFESALTVYRRTLAAAEDHSVAIVVGGGLDAVRALLASPADGLSPLTGLELVTKKVRGLFIAAGRWPVGLSAENADLRASASSGNYIVANWPISVPLIWVGYEVGEVFQTGGDGTVYNWAANNPARACYLPTIFAKSRQGWTQPAILAAVRGLPGMISLISGKSSVITPSGDCAFDPGIFAGHAYSRLIPSAASMVELINPLISRDPAWWPTAPSSYDVDAEIHFAKLKVKDADLRSALSIFVAGLKADGDWSRLEKIFIPAMLHVDDALLDLKGGSSMVLFGGYAHAAAHGLTFNGTTGYADTQFNPATATKFSRDNNSAFCWVRNGAAANITDWGNSQFGSNLLSLSGNFGTNNATATTDSVTGQVSAVGFCGISRTSGTGYSKFRDNGAPVTVPRVSVPLVGDSFFLGARNSGAGVPTLLTTRQYCFWAVGDGSVSANFYSRVQTFLRALGCAPA